MTINNFIADTYEEYLEMKKYLPQNVTAGASGLAAGQTAFTTVATVVPTNWPIAIDDSSHITIDIPHKSAADIFDLFIGPFEFFLGGSRAMKKRGANVTVTSNTDFDFYATDSSEIRNYLDVSGFIMNISSSHQYFDSEAKVIYKKGNIDVVLRKDARFYRDVFENINVEMYVKHLWKGNPKCDRSKIQPLFNEMFRIARAKNEKDDSIRIDIGNVRDIMKASESAKKLMTRVDTTDEESDDEDGDYRIGPAPKLRFETSYGAAVSDTRVINKIGASV